MPSFCFDERVIVDFDTYPNGTAIPKGVYVNMEWFDAYGMEISVIGEGKLLEYLSSIDGAWWAPDGKSARIFDTSAPGTSIADGDPELGSPNEEYGGPRCRTSWRAE